MKLKNIAFENFRNYGKFSFKFNGEKNITAFIGPNASGKTNILEAVFLLAVSKSFRVDNGESLTKWGENFFRVTGKTLKEDEEISLEVFASKYPKKIKQVKVNNVKKKSSDFVGNFFTVLFSPEDLNLVFLSPSLRRKYLDVVLSQVEKNYCRNLISYQKIIRNRNKILFRIRNKTGKNDELLFWDNETAKYGKQIIDSRNRFIEFINKYLGENLNKISGEENKTQLKYINSIGNPSLYLEKLKYCLEKDVCLESTTLGPHRDDIKFIVNGRELKSFGSRGEVRSLVLALKITEIKFFKENTGFSPVLLLDDVFSELDKNRQKFLLDAVKNEQTIITTTSENSLDGIKKINTVFLNK